MVRHVARIRWPRSHLVSYLHSVVPVDTWLSDAKHYEFYIPVAQSMICGPAATHYLGANESETAF